ncbi:MAG: LapA family protein [Pseudomonadota bacterium]
MRIIRTFFWLMTAAVLVGSGIVFYWQNSQEIVLKFAHWTSPPRPMALAMIVAFAIGVVAAGIYFLIDILRLRAQLRKARRLGDLLQRELDALRNAPLYDELPIPSAPGPGPFDQHLTHEGQPEASIDLIDRKRFR